MQMSAAIFIAFSAISRALEIGVFHERARGSGGIASAGADGGDRLIGIDDITRAGDEKGLAFVGDDEQRFKVAEASCRCASPWRAQRRRDSGFLRTAPAWFRSARRERMRRRSIRQSRREFFLIEAANLLGRVLEDVVAERDLPIGGHHHQPRCGARRLRLLTEFEIVGRGWLLCSTSNERPLGTTLRQAGNPERRNHKYRLSPR